jgi:predicted NBD/HSP70 family sugar kinase
LRPAPWLEDNPRDALSRLLGGTALVVNDANLAALGEAGLGAGRGRRAVCYLAVADGIGAGLVFDGRLLPGNGFCVDNAKPGAVGRFAPHGRRPFFR